MSIERLKTDKAIRLDFLQKKEKAPILYTLTLATRMLGGTVAILLLSLFFLWVWRARIQSDAKGLEKKAAAISGLTETYRLIQETRALEQNLSHAGGVLKERSFWAGKLGAITKAIPEGVWLSSLAIGSGKEADSISISGGARSNRHLVLLLQALEGFPWIAKVTLSNSHEEEITIGNLPARYFGFDIKAETKIQ